VDIFETTLGKHVPAKKSIFDVLYDVLGDVIDFTSKHPDYISIYLEIGSPSMKHFSQLLSHRLEEPARDFWLYLVEGGKKRGEIEKIFLSRPVVEAGENLGFLPGDLQEKIDPYIRPIFDALHDMIGKEKTQRMIDTGVLEIAPLAYMRGRTLNNAFAVLDEAQNSTIMQMKMFLTRLGANSKAIVTGDITQIDLVDPSRSGLVVVSEILGDVEGIKFVWFGEEDVVRHSLVKRIIKAFSRIKPEGVSVELDGSGEPEADNE